MRLVFVISSLRCGGAERILSTMASYWAERGWSVTVVTTHAGTEADFYPLSPRIERLKLRTMPPVRNRWEALLEHLDCVWRLRSLVRRVRPDAIISFIDQTNVITLLAAVGLRVPVIACERTDPAAVRLSRVIQVLRRWTYPLAAWIVVQSQGAYRFFSPRLRSRVQIIPNPVGPVCPVRSESLCSAESISGVHSPASPRYLLGMGRLSQEKRFDLLLRAFAQARRDHPEWHLLLLGDGALRPELEQLCARLGIQDWVQMPGQVRDPFSYLLKGDLFVLSSEFEGFPNALCEAMACGLPVISTDCPSGPREIILDGVDGLLVPNGDFAALVSAMARLMADPAERQRLGAAALQITERLSLEKVMGKWESLLAQMAAPSSG